MSSNHKARIAPITNIRRHPNADRLFIADVLGNQIITAVAYIEGTLGIYFNSDLQLSHEFCKANNLYRETSLNASDKETGFFENNRKVKAIKLRGEVSDGLFMPIHTLFDVPGIKSIDDGLLIEGAEFDELQGVSICRKYISASVEKAQRERSTKQSKSKKEKGITKEQFPEHLDTNQLFTNLHKIAGKNLVITEKLHGTSVRVGLVEEPIELSRPQQFVAKVLKWLGFKGVLRGQYKFTVGSRRVIKNSIDLKTSYHRKDLWYDNVKSLDGKLLPGEVLYGEIVGYEDHTKTIMPSVSNVKVSDKQFTAKYGKETKYTYGCQPGESKLFIYRITHMVGGEQLDLNWDQLKQRAEQLGVAVVPEVLSYFPEGAAVDESFFKLLLDGTSILGEHISEGIVVRAEAYPTPIVLKAKGNFFKILEGIAKEADLFDIEEANS